MNRRATLESIRWGASHGAAVWAIYGIVETAVIISVPLLKRLTTTVFPGLALESSSLVSTSVTALVLALYPAFGAALGAAIAALLSKSIRGERSPDGATLWSAVSALTLTVAFGANAVLVGRPSVLAAVLVPLGLGAIRLATAWRRGARLRWSALTHPVWIVVTLIGAALIFQPHGHMSPLVRDALGISYIATVLLFAAVANRIWASIGLCRWIDRRLPRASVGIALMVCLVLALTFVAEVPQRLGPRVGVQAAARAGDKRPNVILISLDTVRADHLSVYGYSRDTTPNLRRLAATSATVFTRAIASSNYTLPTHASLFTGLSPRYHGARRFPPPQRDAPMLEGLPTLPELLAREGYRTAGIVANAGYLSPKFGFDRGVAYYDIVRPTGCFSPPSRAYLFLFRSTVALLIPTAFCNEAESATAESINVRAASFLDESALSRQPFFLFLNYMDAHTPYLPPPPYDGLFAGKDRGFRWSTFGDLVDEVSVRRVRPLHAREFQHLTSQYDGAIAYLDAQLEQLFQKLRTLDLFENSLIVVTSDHGEAFGESQLLGHGSSLYQHQVHVPLIVKYPHAKSGGTSPALASSVDVLPTVLDVVGVAIQTRLEGHSLREIERLAPRWVTSESYSPRGSGFTSVDARPSEIALYSGSLKQILGAGGANELYDLSSDPNEKVNVHGRRAVPGEWLASLTTYMEEARSQPRPGTVTDRELLERLRALGYIR